MRFSVCEVICRRYRLTIDSDGRLCPLRRAQVTNAYLECEKIGRMDWPARSPDLNPIEHVRDILQCAFSARPVQLRTLQELKDALVAEWRMIPQNRIQTLTMSMHSRCRGVIDAHGRHTRY